ncbi:MAG TPA: HD domain-containing protein [Candidatus Saccharimonadales bacterium]|nr:HD domain-containing protein [Candidatus Saccharimonadales bacterium]
MDTNTLREKTEEFVKSRLSGEGTGHDWWHAVRVINIARKIHAIEGGDWSIIELALLLHDVGDRKVIDKDDDDYSIAEDFLIGQNVSAVTINAVMSIIKTMSYSKSFDASERNDSIEFKIVQDADRLDAIGAIGIGRAFAYGGSRSRLLYDPDEKPQAFTSSGAYKKSEGSTIQHFYEKLLLIKDKLNTKAAKEIAVKRHEFMQRFLQEFLDEWNGQK